MSYTIAYNLTELSTDIYLPSAYIVALDAAGILTHRKDKATETSLSNMGIPLTPTVKKLFDTIVLLSPKNLEKKFNGTAKKPVPLLVLLQDKAVKEAVMKFVHRHLDAFLQTILVENLPICFDLERKQLVHLTQLTLNPTPLQPDIYFERNTEGLLYRLQMLENNKAWRVQEKPCLLLCNEPAWLIRDGQLSTIEGMNGFRLKAFKDKDAVIIPQAKVKEYCQKIILPMLEKIDFRHAGFDIVVHQLVQKSTLILTHDFIHHSAGLALTFDYGKQSFNWKETRTQRSFLEVNAQEEVVIHHVKRDAEAELSFVQELRNLGLDSSSFNHFSLQNLPNASTAAVIDWLMTHQKDLESKGFTVELPVVENKTIALLRPQLALQKSEENDWFDLKGHILVGEFSIPFGQLVPNIRDNNPYFLLPNGLYFLIPDAWFETYANVARFGKIDGATIRIKRHQAAHLLDKNEASDAEKMTAEIPSWTPPQYLKADLRPYQIEGVQWLIQHYFNNKGALLADDMGLGKSLQTIAMLLFAKENKGDEGNNTPVGTGRQMSVFDAQPTDNFLKPLQAILVLPASLVYNWQNEWKKFGIIGFMVQTLLRSIAHVPKTALLPYCLFSYSLSSLFS